MKFEKNHIIYLILFDFNVGIKCKRFRKGDKVKKAYEAPMINEELIEVLDVIATSNGGDTVDGISINMGSLFPKGGNQ